jgi:predicted RNA-binding protein YlxR (DUF448 family)
MLNAASESMTDAAEGTVADASPRAAATRRCLVSGEERPKAELVRFVVGPDGTVVPDVDGRLPGRGLWALARRDIVATAVARKLFARAARGPATADAGLVDRLEGLLARRCLATLGFARRAGQAVGGYEKVRSLIERGACGALIVAAEASADGRRKVASGIEALPIVGVLTESELGGVFGRESVTYAAVARGGNAQRCLEEAARLSGFRVVS